MGSFEARRCFALAVMLTGITVSGSLVSGCADTTGTTADENSRAAPSGGVVGDTALSVTGSSSPVSPASTTLDGSIPSLFDFSTTEFITDQGVEGWSVVNDTVMGGVSSGRLAVEDGVMFFSGELSLENNGGFASVRSPLIEPQSAEVWSNRVGPQIVFIGDGRTWTVEVRTDDVDGGWIASLPTTTGSTTEMVLPWTSFEPVTRFLNPRPTDEPLDPRRILSVAFYLVDGIEGSFRLGIQSIS